MQGLQPLPPKGKDPAHIPIYPSSRAAAYCISASNDTYRTAPRGTSQITAANEKAKNGVPVSFPKSKSQFTQTRPIACTTGPLAHTAAHPGRPHERSTHPIKKGQAASPVYARIRNMQIYHRGVGKAAAASCKLSIIDPGNDRSCARSLPTLRVYGLSLSLSPRTYTHSSLGFFLPNSIHPMCSLLLLRGAGGRGISPRDGILICAHGRMKIGLLPLPLLEVDCGLARGWEKGYLGELFLIEGPWVKMCVIFVFLVSFRKGLKIKLAGRNSTWLSSVLTSWLQRVI